MKNIILLHGALGSAETLHNLKDLLSEQFNVILLEFPGHGKNEEVEFGIDAFSASLDNLTHDLEEYSIFGYSMGGYVALKFASANPAGLQKIVTLATKFDWTPETAATEVKKLNPEIIEQKVPKFGEYLNNLHSDWKVLMQKTASMMTQMGEDSGLSNELLRAVSVPVVLFRGSEDTMVSSRETELVAKELQNGRFELLEGVQHPIDRIDQQLIADLIRKEMA